MIIGAQLWIFSQWPDLEEQIGGLLSALAREGYEAIEGMRGKAPHDAKIVHRAGLNYAATHLTPAVLEPLNPLLDFLTEAGIQHVCSSGPLEWDARTVGDYRRTAAFLNEKGRLLREHGIHLHYHNHDFEFGQLDGGRTAMDLLLSELDPDAVTLCFDAGWAELAGHSAAEFMTEHGPRIPLLHLRDFRGTQSVLLGQGTIDLAPQIALLSQMPNLKYLMVEQDPSADPLGDMLASRRYLRDTFGL